jgi:hypothetical protein
VDERGLAEATHRHDAAGQALDIRDTLKFLRIKGVIAGNKSRDLSVFPVSIGEMDNPQFLLEHLELLYALLYEPANFLQT